MENSIFRGEIYYADLSSTHSSEQDGIRPVLVIQNNIGNKHAPTVIVLPLTSQLKKNELPTHIAIAGCGLKRPSIILCEQIRTINKDRLLGKIGQADKSTMIAVGQGIRISLGLY